MEQANCGHLEDGPTKAFEEWFKSNEIDAKC